MGEFKMPSMGADMESGTLVEWKLKPGDPVKRGDIIAVIETAKGIVDIEVFETGILDQIFYTTGQEVPVGQVLATIRTEEEPMQEKVGLKVSNKPEILEIKTPEVISASPSEKTSQFQMDKTKKSSGRIKISPLASKIALDLGVDINSIRGTGPGGAIQRSDVEKAAQAMKAVASKSPVPEAKEAIPELKPAETQAQPQAPTGEAKRTTADFQTAMRQAIAAAMSRSNREIPHYYLETQIDMSKALNWLEEENHKRSMKERLLPVVILVKAVAKSLTEVPELNGYWIDGAHQISEAIHIGFAIALRQGGLVTPAIHHVDLQSFDELREAMNDLIIRTRAGRLKSSELTDATITVTSLGERGVEKVFGVIYPPQVALVGLGKITNQPWVENGMIGIRPVITATLSGDHRATDGHLGGLFLEALKRNLQEVEKL